MSNDDRWLLDKANRRLAGAELSEQGVRDVSATGGIDLATAVLYQHIRTCAQHAAFIRQVESGEPADSPAEAPCVVVMPGAFHVEYPETGADGARVLELAAELGWSAETVAVPSLGSMAKNAQALVEVLSRRRGQRIILVSLSKGGADVCAALARSEALSEMRDVRAWVNISGMVCGTPLVAWLRARPLRCLGVRLLLRLRGQRFAHVEELGRGSVLKEPLKLPPQIRAIHVVGFPLARHLSNDWARRGHARLAPLGPNDGGGILLHDVARLPGHVYPVWGADHYLKPAWDIKPLLLSLLREAVREPAVKSAPSPLPDAKPTHEP